MTGEVIEVPGLSRAAIRAYAKKVHELIRLQQPPFPIVQFAEGLHAYLPEFTFAVMDEEELGNNHGLTMPAEKLMMIRRDVYEGACRDAGRDRLTIAHEVGHLLLHDSVAFARRMPSKDVPAYRSSEWQANCFAGELLVPAWWLKSVGRISALDVANVCKVSVEAASYQLNHQK
jgi:Zn-dependent peptidase ImmA (M78 family)